ncbi:MAG TPA: hypothetical protein VHI13_04260 [Candidatus Kapabacteria bacterium]|nr:hypothetical protein [Candidatus Kapabacteria bacterium]
MSDDTTIRTTDAAAGGESDANSGDHRLITSVRKSLANGGHPRHIENRLVGEGVDRTTAAATVNQAIRERDEELTRMRTKGGFWLGGGLLLSIVAFMATSSAGSGRYIIAWGPVIYGIVLLVNASKLAKGVEDQLADRDFAAVVDCPLCRARVELDDDEWESGLFTCPACSRDVNLADGPETVQCPWCRSSIDLDREESRTGRFVCPACSRQVELKRTSAA